MARRDSFPAVLSLQGMGESSAGVREKPSASTNSARDKRRQARSSSEQQAERLMAAAADGRQRAFNVKFVLLVLTVSRSQ